MIVAVLLGVVMGFFGAIPVAGPVSAMVLERALVRRYAAAFAVAIGSAMAEGVYAALAVLGVSFLTDFPWMEAASKAVAAVILIAVGLSFALRKAKPGEEAPVDHEAAAAVDNTLRQWAIGFTMTIVNPAMLATWTAAMSMVVAAGVELRPVIAAPFGLAVAVGVSAWFALVLYLVRRFTKQIKPTAIHRVIRYIGWGLVALGGWFVVLFLRVILG